ncbi:MAG: glycine--tRNA ligase [Mycoplasma sp.]
MSKYTQLEIVNYLKNYGFVFPNSEIYNGLANAWDFGSVGSLLKKNIKDLWWKRFVTTRPDIVPLDTNIIYNSDVWKASGHISNFSDPLIDCKKCKSRLRADKLIESHDENIIVNENDSNEVLLDIILKNNIKCPNCQGHEWTEIRKFNLMFKTFQGVVEDSLNTLYLRPETAQGIFINFKNIQRTARTKVPFGIAQIGKAFRNEITPGNFIFRTREFEQMEIEYFIHPDSIETNFNNSITQVKDFLLNDCKINPELIREYEHPKDKLSHYSSKTIDMEFNFPHGWSELCGIAHRGNYDLTVHENLSKKDLKYLDPVTNEKYLPHVIEPSIGVDRLFYAIITSAYEVQQLDEKDSREVLNLPITLCPYKIAILPLTNKLNEEATKIYNKFLEKGISCTFDTSGSIGKRYRRQDAIGTMYCLTVDFDTVEKNTVTIRNRNDMQQITISIDEIERFIFDNLF